MAAKPVEKCAGVQDLDVSTPLFMADCSSHLCPPSILPATRRLLHSSLSHAVGLHLRQFKFPSSFKLSKCGYVIVSSRVRVRAQTVFLNFSRISIIQCATWLCSSIAIGHMMSGSRHWAQIHGQYCLQCLDCTGALSKARENYSKLRLSI